MRTLVVPYIRKYMSDCRYRKARPFLKGNTIDVGCEWYRDGFNVCCDLNPKDKRIKKQNIYTLKYGDKSFDTVCCLETLEHLHNPIKAMDELKRIAKKRIIITVPSEPWFSLARLSWNKEHLWALSPKLLKHYFGKPIYECRFKLRWYFAVWDIR